MSKEAEGKTAGEVAASVTNAMSAAGELAASVASTMSTLGSAVSSTAGSTVACGPSADTLTYWTDGKMFKAEMTPLWDSSTSGVTLGTSTSGTAWTTDSGIRISKATALDAGVGEVTLAAAEIIYADNIMPHLVRAKEEGIRRNIEMDTIVIDQGVAMAQGIGHADMILGLKVKYVKEGMLPMDSAFVMFKDKKGAAACDGEAGKKSEASGAGGMLPGVPPQFLKIKNGADSERLIRIDHIIEVKDEFCGSDGTSRGLKIYYDAGPTVREVMIHGMKEAEAIRKYLDQYSAGL